MQTILSVSDGEIIVYCWGCSALSGKPSPCSVYTRYEHSFSPVHAAD